MDDPANPKLLCRTKVAYGTGDGWMNEMGYIGGNLPCIFGNAADGFQAPVALKPDTKLMSIKYQNNTHVRCEGPFGRVHLNVSNNGSRRYGDMALWELRGVTL